MIHYQLLCEHDHEFEAWFRDSAAFDEQAARGEIECPFCGSVVVRKAVMAPNVASRKDAMVSNNQQMAITAAEKAADDIRGGADPQDVAIQFMEVVGKLQKHVEDTFDYVGSDFAEEARAIHNGDAQDRGIYGEATADETRQLRDEGIDVFALPKLADKEKAN